MSDLSETLIGQEEGRVPYAYQDSRYVWGDTRFRQQFLTGIQLVKIVVPYSASMTFDCRTGNFFQITATTNAAFTINNPTEDVINGADGTQLTVQIRNTSGGALGLISFGTLFKLNGSAWPSPANGQNSSVTFMRDETLNFWYEISRQTAVPN